ncbi:MAG: DNA polymerase III subunit gamma/tau [Ignavibacteriae bacterium]|nr:DNA polymerase III subunit gamma/tau [Ignavibacteriota bacterium]MCB9244200.1 DNA polymerase III subunit gamma/tau [Ignavibacteriales bacterium]
MSEYQVSARKFRPQKFSEVTSQEFVTKTLKNAIKSNKIAHAYLLSGPRGVGKTTIARIFAKALNCLNPKDGEPDDTCENCIEIKKGVHPDILELDAASNRGIDDVRAIQDAAKIFPMKAKYKFFIIDEVHMLTTQAFNALLKILEEPPPYLIFILATTNPEKIPQTIVSRCQRFSLQMIKVDEISENLRSIAKQEGIKIDDESLFLISKLGYGALRDAQGIFDMAVSYCGNEIKFEELKAFLNLPDKEVYFKIADFIKDGDTKGILNYLNELSAKGMDLHTVYNGITEHFRNLLILKTAENPDLLDESDQTKKQYEEQAKNFTRDQVLRILKVMFDAESRIRYSSNQKILFEALIVELCDLNKEVVDISKLISEIDALKKKTKLGSNETSYTEPDPPAETPIIEEKQDPAKESEVVKKLKELFDVEKHNNN